MGGSMGEQADSQAFQAEGLTDPQNSVGAGALIGQLSTVSQATSQASPPAVLPASASEDVKVQQRYPSSFCIVTGCSYFNRE